MKKRKLLYTTSRFLLCMNGLVGMVQIWRDYKISVIQIEDPGGCLKFLAPFAKGRVTLTQTETSMWHSGKSGRITSEIKQSWPLTPGGSASLQSANAAKQSLGSSLPPLLSPLTPSVTLPFFVCSGASISIPAPLPALTHTSAHTYPSWVSIPRFPLAVTPSLPSSLLSLWHSAGLLCISLCLQANICCSSL